MRRTEARVDFIGESDNNDSLFLKFDSLSKNGNLVRVWSQTLANEVRKSVTLYQFDLSRTRFEAYSPQLIYAAKLMLQRARVHGLTLYRTLSQDVGEGGL